MMISIYLVAIVFVLCLNGSHDPMPNKLDFTDTYPGINFKMSQSTNDGLKATGHDWYVTEHAFYWDKSISFEKIDDVSAWIAHDGAVVAVLPAGFNVQRDPYNDPYPVVCIGRVPDTIYGASVRKKFVRSSPKKMSITYKPTNDYNHNSNYKAKNDEKEGNAEQVIIIIVCCVIAVCIGAICYFAFGRRKDNRNLQPRMINFNPQPMALPQRPSMMINAQPMAPQQFQCYPQSMPMNHGTPNEYGGYNEGEGNQNYVMPSAPNV